MTVQNKKQLTLTNLFRKKGVHLPEDCEELEEEISQLEQKLKDVQMELFQVQRNCLKHKSSPPKSRNEQFVRPDTIVKKNSVDYFKRSLELMAMLTGMEVKSYVTNDHCVIVYHMQHKSQYELQHGLKINLRSGDNTILKVSLPIGFNFNAVVEEFDNIMTPECLSSIRKALVAYYDRFEQFEKLKSVLTIEAQMFKITDGTHMEISFKAQSVLDEEEEQIHVVLLLDYRVYDIRPRQFSFKEIDLPEGVSRILNDQCAVLKRKPLHKAFKECFLSGTGPYKFVHQVSRPPTERARRPKRRRRDHYDPRRDDTFVPEDCSQSSEEEDERYLREEYGRR